LKHPFEVKDLPIDHITIFPDQAEVVRSMSIRVLAVGVQDIVISGFSNRVLPNSFRVEGVGDATILEVSYETVYPQENKQEESEEQVLINSIDKDIARVDEQIKRINAEKDFCNNYMKSLNNKEKLIPIEELAKYLDFYKKSMGRIDALLLEESSKKKIIRGEKKRSIYYFKKEKCTIASANQNSNHKSLC